MAKFKKGDYCFKNTKRSKTVVKIIDIETNERSGTVWYKYSSPLFKKFQLMPVSVFDKQSELANNEEIILYGGNNG